MNKRIHLKKLKQLSKKLDKLEHSTIEATIVCMLILCGGNYKREYKVMKYWDNILRKEYI